MDNIEMKIRERLGLIKASSEKENAEDIWKEKVTSFRNKLINELKEYKRKVFLCAEDDDDYDSMRNSIFEAGGKYMVMKDIADDYVRCIENDPETYTLIIDRLMKVDGLLELAYQCWLKGHWYQDSTADAMGDVLDAFRASLKDF